MHVPGTGDLVPTAGHSAFLSLAWVPAGIGIALP